MTRKVKYLALMLVSGAALFQCGCPALCGLPKGCALIRVVSLWLQEDLFG